MDLSALTKIYIKIQEAFDRLRIALNEQTKEFNNLIEGCRLHFSNKHKMREKLSYFQGRSSSHEQVLVDLQSQSSYLQEQTRLLFQYLQENQQKDIVVKESSQMNNEKKGANSMQMQNSIQAKTVNPIQMNVPQLQIKQQEIPHPKKYDDGINSIQMNVPQLQMQPQETPHPRINDDGMDSDQFKQEQFKQIQQKIEEQKERKIRGQYKSYTEVEKQQAVTRINNGANLREVSKETGIPRKNLKRWMITGIQRKKGGGRKTQDPEMEQKLFDWVMEQAKNFKEGHKITRNNIIQQAKSLANNDGFKASKGWFDKFTKRYNLYTNMDRMSMDMKPIFGIGTTENAKQEFNAPINFMEYDQLSDDSPPEKEYKKQCLDDVKNQQLVDDDDSGIYFLISQHLKEMDNVDKEQLYLSEDS